METVAVQVRFACDETGEGVDYEALARLCERRADTYGLLARIYRTEVDEALMAQLKETRFPLYCENDAMAQGYRLIVGYLSAAWENTLFELAVDYVRAFIGHGINGHAAAYPYESAYCSTKHLLMQGSRDEVVAIYRACGFEKEGCWNDGEDHAAVELEFMQLLARRAALQARAGDEAALLATLRTQRGFMDEHIEAWMPRFLPEVETFAQTDFYKGFAQLTAGYLEEDAAFLAGVLD